MITITRKGQVWIETVLYTLIGLVLIGLVLAFVIPKINEARDRAVVEQTIASLDGFDEKIQSALVAPDNRRFVDFTIKRGELYINGESNEIIFLINDLKKPYSEPNVLISIGRIKALSRQEQKFSSISLVLNYSGQFNLTYGGQDEIKKFSAASTPYSFYITNKGFDNNVYLVDIEATR